MLLISAKHLSMVFEVFAGLQGLQKIHLLKLLDLLDGVFDIGSHLGQRRFFFLLGTLPGHLSLYVAVWLLMLYTRVHLKGVVSCKLSLCGLRLLLVPLLLTSSHELGLAGVD